jgi:drug/metabolite transporter (DMT)-like permease
MGFAAYNVALAYGQVALSAGTAGLLHTSIPVFTALLAVAFLGERVGAGVGWHSRQLLGGGPDLPRRRR